MSNPAQGNWQWYLKPTTMVHYSSQEPVSQQKRFQLSGQRQGYTTPLMDQKTLCPPAEEVPTLRPMAMVHQPLFEVLTRRSSVSQQSRPDGTSQDIGRANHCSKIPGICDKAAMTCVLQLTLNPRCQASHSPYGPEDPLSASRGGPNFQVSGNGTLLLLWTRRASVCQQRRSQLSGNGNGKSTVHQDLDSECLCCF